MLRYHSLFSNKAKVSDMRERKIRLLEAIKKYFFDKLFKTRGNYRERRRYLAFAHIGEGKSFIETAKMVRVELCTLMNWVDSFRKRGIEGLKDKYGGEAKKPHIRARLCSHEKK